MIINRENAEQIAKELGIDYNNSPIFTRIKTEDNQLRLHNAISSLPLPAAFNDAKITLRKIRKENNSTDDTELNLIYKLAIWESFCVTSYSKIAECPTYNILEAAFEEVKMLEYDWNSFGYEKLNLLKSDIKAMVAIWGEPKKHTTLNKKYNDLYRKYELKCKENLF